MRPAELQVPLTGQGARQDDGVIRIGGEPASFGKAHLGLGQVPTQQQEVPQGNEGPSPQSQVARGQVQRCAELLASLRPVSVRGPERRHRGAEAKGDGVVPRHDPRGDRTPNVVLVRSQVGHDLRLAAAADRGLDTLDPIGEPASMASGHFVVFAQCLQLDASQLPDRLEHRPAFRQLGVGNEQRRAGQVPEASGDVAARAGEAAADFGDRFGCPAACERGESSEEEAFVGWEQVEAPLQRRAKRLVARRCGPPPTRQK